MKMDSSGAIFGRYLFSFRKKCKKKNRQIEREDAVFGEFEDVSVRLAFLWNRAWKLFIQRCRSATELARFSNNNDGKGYFVA